MKAAVMPTKSFSQMILQNYTVETIWPDSSAVRAPPCHGGSRGFESRSGRHCGNSGDGRACKAPPRGFEYLCRNHLALSSIGRIADSQSVEESSILSRATKQVPPLDLMVESLPRGEVRFESSTRVPHLPRLAKITGLIRRVPRQELRVLANLPASVVQW